VNAEHEGFQHGGEMHEKAALTGLALPSTSQCDLTGSACWRTLDGGFSSGNEHVGGLQTTTAPDCWASSASAEPDGKQQHSPRCPRTGGGRPREKGCPARREQEDNVGLGLG